MTGFEKIDHPEISDIFVLPTKEEASRFSADLIAGVVKDKPNSRITFATGNSQLLVYKYLADISNRGELNFSKMSAFHLDEYYPCKRDSDFGFVNYLYKNVFSPLKLSHRQIFTINGIASDPASEAKRYETLLREKPIDLTILGIGPGGHIGFCESGTPFDGVTQLIDLSPETIYRDTIERKQKSPPQAITQGISTILSSNKIILNAFDARHGRVMKEVLYGKISPKIPGSSLRTVGEKVTIVMDREAADAATS